MGEKSRSVSYKLTKNIKHTALIFFIYYLLKI